MSKKKPTKHKANEERTTLLFFFPKTEKHQRSQSPRKHWNVHTRGERARETARETAREERRASGYQSHPDISQRDWQRPVTTRVRLPIPPGYKSEGSCERKESGYQLCSVAIEGKKSVRLPVTNSSDQGKRNAEGRAGGQALPSSSL
jgi:hypothetical protein